MTVEIRLDPQEWNQLLAVLAQAPWNIANPLIMKIGEQLRAQQPEAVETRRSNSAGPPKPDIVEH